MRQVEAGVHCGAARGGNGAYIIVNDRVGIKRQPFLHPGKPPGKVKAGTPEARVISALFLGQAHVAEAGEAVPERAKGERHMVLARKDHHAGKAKFQVPGRLEAEFLRVDPRRIGITMSLQRAEQTFVAKRS